MATNPKATGLNSPNMSKADKDRIHKMGGEAHAKDTATSTSSTNASSTNLSAADRAKGGRTSRSSK